MELGFTIKSGHSVRIAGMDWRILMVDGEECDGATYPEKRIIAIRHNLDKARKLSVLHHELFEAVCQSMGCSYSRSYPETKDLYIMTHCEMSSIMREVSAVFIDCVDRMKLLK